MAPAIERQAERFEQEHRKRKLLPEPIADLPDKYLKQMKEIIDNSDGPVTKSPRMTEKEVRQEGAETAPKLNHPLHRPSTMEEAVVYEMHLQWIKECFDLISGKPNANYLSESEWLKLQK